MPNNNDILKHYGTQYYSGRYPYGSGEEPYQGEGWYNAYRRLKAKGFSPQQIVKEMGMKNTTELRTQITYAKREEASYFRKAFRKDIKAGMNQSEIAEKYGVSEGTVRNYLKEATKHKTLQTEQIETVLKDAVVKNKHLDVGVGVEHQLGVPRNRLNTVVNKMVQEDGYFVHNVFVRRLSDTTNMKPVTVKVLTKEPDVKKVVEERDNISTLEAWSDDRGETIRYLQPPKSIDLDRVHIRYIEDGGADKDGLIELRPGATDLDMGASHYAQVRIRVDGDRFLKGMAAYGDPKDFPKGTDIIFNANKHNTESKRDVLKKVKFDADGKQLEGADMFGSLISRQNESRVLNIVNEEGEWDTWSTNLASQFLGKQPTSLIKDRLVATQEQLVNNYNDILELTNPVVQEHLLKNFSNGLVSKTKKLSAKGMPDTKSHVILPFPGMNPKEIYAPNYNNGDRVVLLRYPHGGVFELPEVTVNNKNKEAKKMLGIAPDAIGLHPSVAMKMSGADFDGDTVYVIPNREGRIKTSRSLKELKNFDPMDYKVNYETMSKRYKETQMGIVSNLITDMTIKGAHDSEIARAVKHSMVVIDAHKHKLDYKQSAKDNNILELRRKYMKHVSPETGKTSMGASTLLSRSKKKIDLSDPKFDVYKYSSGSDVETLYADYVDKTLKLKNEADVYRSTLKPLPYNRMANKKYKKEVDSLKEKVKIAQMNAPRERQAQIRSQTLFYSNIRPDMDKDDYKKLRTQALAQAREEVGASQRVKSGPNKGDKTNVVNVTPKEWEAVDNQAVSTDLLRNILRYANEEQIVKYATPRDNKLPTAKATRAKSMINNGYTYAEVAKALGISKTSIRDLVKE